jgi:hypothetical protein
MNIYLAGPMRGIPHFNHPAFHEAAASLRAQGHFVFSPAENDIDKYGHNFSTENTTGDNDQATKNHGFSLRNALATDTNFICLHADAIAMLPGWETSKGATAEWRLAIALNLNIIYLTPLRK